MGSADQSPFLIHRRRRSRNRLWRSVPAQKSARPQAHCSREKETAVCLSFPCYREGTQISLAGWLWPFSGKQSTCVASSAEAAVGQLLSLCLSLLALRWDYRPCLGITSRGREQKGKWCRSGARGTTPVCPAPSFHLGLASKAPVAISRPVHQPGRGGRGSMGWRSGKSLPRAFK